MHSVSILRRLSNIISDAVDNIEQAYENAQLALPSLDQPFDENDPAEALRRHPAVSAATNNIMAAAAQMSAIVCDPRRGAVNAANSFHLSSCLLAASEFNVVEILREAGAEGANATDIAALSGVDPGLMGQQSCRVYFVVDSDSMTARILRLLATHHIFQELSPGVFTNNKISSALDKGRPARVLHSNKEDRLIGSSGVAAMAEHTRANVGMDAGTAESASPIPFLWVSTPLKYHIGYDWSQLPAGGKIVDVGGGIGHVSLTIAKNYPHLRVVNQDLGQPIEISKAHWRKIFPEHLDSQMVEFQVHDFFAAQPVKDAAVFLLRYILHDWTDEKAIVLLRSLRAAALPTTRLVIAEKILPYASRVDRKSDIPGAALPAAEAPLLPNWGPAMADLYFYDLTMHVLLGGVERTLDGFREMLAESGWRQAN
ncbi:O-methyltransferase [Mycena venus]|uniref:O-methyltransferase n=1 Tax=Mycena venus TaxID=2733690 RepID=A0A8H7CHG4_9AGAR|nr:O-methyltransferase [Mycena venus]